MAAVTVDDFKSEKVSKKEAIAFLQENATVQFLKDQKLFGKLQAIAKGSSKDKVLNALTAFESDPVARKGDEDADLAEALEQTKALKIKEDEAKKNQKEAAKEDAAVTDEKVGFTKKIIKKGKTHMKPEKGSVVSVWYTGQLEDGTVFDSNVENSRKKDRKALKFKVGTGLVIRGWDEALLTMTYGEKAEITIDPDWAYGKKGMPNAGIQPNATLIFEVELEVPANIGV
ncbi:peptidyl-prolyl cis-trans isomerase FKBP3-like [Bolinopsis microptera]|uniref:peptidyl-prolyl cis-trans isomerase FKBP3-like n=1 Tax=Bolinopsis microptera TaxID=2820187 RepID=UPI0030790E4D